MNVNEVREARLDMVRNAKVRLEQPQAANATDVETKTVQFNIRLTPSFKAAMVDLAETMGVSLSEFIEVAVAHYAEGIARK